MRARSLSRCLDAPTSRQLRLQEGADQQTRLFAESSPRAFPVGNDAHAEAESFPKRTGTGGTWNPAKERTRPGGVRHAAKLLLYPCLRVSDASATSISMVSRPSRHLGPPSLSLSSSSSSFSTKPVRVCVCPRRVYTSSFLFFFFFLKYESCVLRLGPGRPGQACCSQYMRTGMNAILHRATIDHGAGADTAPLLLRTTVCVP